MFKWFLYILLINIIVSIIMTIYGLSKQTCKNKKNNYLKYIHQNYRVYRKTSDWIIERVSIYIVSYVCLYIDFLGNGFKLLFKSWDFNIDSNRKYNRNIDFLIISYFLFEIFIFTRSLYYTYKNEFEMFSCGFFLWRITTIIFYKLNDLLLFNYNFAKYSYNRTLLIFIINYIEITVMFTFIFSSPSIAVFPRNSGTIFHTLHIYTNWSINNIDFLCINQKILIASQIFSFIILVLVFLTNLSNFSYLRGKKQ